MKDLHHQQEVPRTELIPENLADLFIIEEKYDADEVKEHYKYIAVNGWEAWHHYRNDMDKIVYYGGTVFITIITTTGLIGVIGDKELTAAISIFQMIIFHLIFLIIFLAHTYKRLISDVSFVFAKAADEYYQTRFNELLDNKFEFISIKNYFTKPGRLLLKTFNFGIIIIYTLVTSAPFFKINLGVDGVAIEIQGWEFIVTLICFIIILFIVNRETEKEIKRVKIKISREFDKHLKKIESKNVS